MVKYDYKKTLKKVLTVGIPVILAGIAAQYGDSQAYLALAPVIAVITNVLKHKFGLDLKVV